MPSAPLAGRPPYATDEDDSIFTTAPLATRRTAPPKPDNPNNRSSAYDVYDDYLPDSKQSSSNNPFKSPPATPAGHLRAPKDTSATEANRQSGVGGIGMGLLNMDYSDSEDDDDDEPPKKVVKPAAAPAAATAAPPSAGNNTKNAALLAAIGNIGDHSTPPKPPAATLAINSNEASPRSPPPIAAPRPGYAAPVPATFGQNPFEGGIPPPQPIGGVPTPVSQPMVQIPPAAYPRDGPPHSPLPLSLSPAPLQAPATPIMPVFALPRKPSGDKEGAGVKFEVGTSPLPRNKPIMRSQTEDPLLPRRGEKGDDFWRRFSMVAREDSKGKKESSWLRKTRNGLNGFSRWVWIIGLILLLAIVGSIALGVVLSMGKEDEAPKEPEILAGNTSKVAGAVETGAVGGVAPAGGPGGGGPARGGDAAGLGPTTSRAILHVTPTHTIRALAFDTEGIVMPLPTGVAKVFGDVEGLVKEKRNSSSTEARRSVGERRRGHRVRRWD